MSLLPRLFSMLSGIGVFIFSMSSMSQGLQKISGEKAKNILAKISGNAITGISFGFIVTAIVQSSLATIVMAIGLVNANTINLTQATYIIMGSNIGTTTTSFLASLQSLNLNMYFCLCAFIGVFLGFFKNTHLKNISKVVSGFGIMFVALKLMSDSFNDEKVREKITTILNVISNPLLLYMIGVIITFIMQSSTAVSGILIVMLDNASLSLPSALFVNLGSNVGSCLVAFLSSLDGGVQGKRAALIHLFFNFFGSFLFLFFLLFAENFFVFFLSKISSSKSFQLSFFHLFFNILTSAVLLPFTQKLINLTKNFSTKKKNTFNKNYMEYILGKFGDMFSGENKGELTSFSEIDTFIDTAEEDENDNYSSLIFSLLKFLIKKSKIFFLLKNNIENFKQFEKVEKYEENIKIKKSNNITNIYSEYNESENNMKTEESERDNNKDEEEKLNRGNHILNVRNNIIENEGGYNEWINPCSLFSLLEKEEKNLSKIFYYLKQKIKNKLIEEENKNKIIDCYREIREIRTKIGMNGFKNNSIDNSNIDNIIDNSDNNILSTINSSSTSNTYISSLYTKNSNIKNSFISFSFFSELFFYFFFIFDILFEIDKILTFEENKKNEKKETNIETTINDSNNNNNNNSDFDNKNKENTTNAENEETYNGNESGEKIGEGD